MSGCPFCAVLAELTEEVRQLRVEVQQLRRGGGLPPQTAAGGLLSVKEAAAFCRISVSMVRLLIDRKQIAVQRIGKRVLIPPASLDEYLARQREPAPLPQPPPTVEREFKRIMQKRRS